MAEDAHTFCTCNRGPEGFTFDPARQLWVHVTCGLPTRHHYEAVSLEELL